MHLRPLIPAAGWLALALLLIAGIASAHAAGPAARVAAIAGEVSAIGRDGASRELRQDMEIHAGDTIQTGAGGRVRLVFSDGSARTLRPGTILVIEAYRHEGNAETDSSVSRLIRGGMRAVTGAIGAANHESERTETPVGTIGIRGTEYLARFCRGDCADGQVPGEEPPADGLYTHTLSGATVVTGVQVAAGLSSHTDMQGRTRLLTRMPSVLEDREAGIDWLGTGIPGTGTVDAVFEIPAQHVGTRFLLCD